MAIRVEVGARADGTVSGDVELEQVELPGAVEGDEYEVYEFAIPRLGRILRANREMKGLNEVLAAQEFSDAAFDWLQEGFGPDAWAHIRERLADREDRLDDEHLLYLFRVLTSRNTGRPTTSSNGAARQPWKRPSTVAQSASVSVSES